MIDSRTASAAVGGGLLLAASVAAELVHPVQAADGTVLEHLPFAGYLLAWVAGAALLVRAAVGLPSGTRAERIGRVLCVAGLGLLLAFGVVVLVTGLSGKPLEASFIVFALGLLLTAAGSLTAGIARGRLGWPLVVAAAGALVALLTEQLHDVGLFVLFGAWVALGMWVRARRDAAVGIPVA